MMQFEIKSRLTGNVIYTCEIEADYDTRYAIKLGRALIQAIQDGANLREASLRDAYMRDADMSDVPAIENIHTKVYQAASQPGALDMSTWHCGTTHCRAGWVVTLAGEEGAKLEAKIGTPAAAMAIYIASDPERWKVERLPDFHTTNEVALADMKRLAEEVTA